MNIVIHGSFNEAGAEPLPCNLGFTDFESHPDCPCKGSYVIPGPYTELVKMFFEAIRLHNLSAVKNMVTKYPTIIRPKIVDDGYKKSCASPFWTALLTGRAEVVELLLKSGADPHESHWNSKGTRTLTFLQYFAQAENWRDMTKMVELLMRWGVTLQQKDDLLNQCCPLEIAFNARNLECAKYLYEQGADLAFNSSSMMNLAHTIKLTEDPFLRRDMCMLLIKSGINEKCLAHKVNNILFYLLDVECQHEWCSKVSLCDVVSIFLDHGVDVNQVLIQSKAPLLSQALCRFCGDLDLISLLIKRGADVEKRDISDATPLFYATHNIKHQLVKPLEMIGMLVDAGANINQTFLNGETILHEACELLSSDSNPHRLISYLVEEMGVDINFKNEKGITPFHTLRHSLDINEGYVRGFAQRGRVYPLGYDIDEYRKCIKVFVKKLAQRVFEKQPFFSSDIELVNENLIAKTLYEECMQELLGMAATKLYKSYTYHSFLASTKISNFAMMTNNPEFIKTVINNNTWTNYHHDLLKRMKEAINYYDRQRAMEQALTSVFFGILPSLPISRIVYFLMN